MWLLKRSTRSIAGCARASSSNLQRTMTVSFAVGSAALIALNRLVQVTKSPIRPGSKTAKRRGRVMTTSTRSRDPELLHARFERGRLEVQCFGGAARSAHFPLRSLERPHDVLALELLEALTAGFRQGHRLVLTGYPLRELERRARRHDDR